MPTLTPQILMHHIRYAQCLLKIDVLRCKVRSKFDRLSLITVGGFSASLLMEVFFCPRNLSKCLQNESATERHREGGFLSWFERLMRVSQKYIVSYFPCFLVHFSSGRLCSCQMNAIIWQLSDLFKGDEMLYVLFSIVRDVLFEIQPVYVWTVHLSIVPVSFTSWGENWKQTKQWLFWKSSEI